MFGCVDAGLWPAEVQRWCAGVTTDPSERLRWEAFEGARGKAWGWALLADCFVKLANGRCWTLQHRQPVKHESYRFSWTPRPSVDATLACTEQAPVAVLHLQPPGPVRVL